jgi:RNA polymerase sigma-70 factor (ECF subfamily)
MNERVSSADEVVEQLRQGDPEAWARLHREQYPRIWSTVSRILNSESQAEDVTQEAFVKAYQQIGRFNGQSQIGTWLYRIAVNQALDQTRKIKRRERVLSFFSPLKSEEEGQTSVPDMPVEPEAARGLERAEMRGEIKAAMAKLTPEHRAVVQLRLVEELSPAETAAALGCKEGTVNSRLHYACDQLRAILGKKNKHE